jgi:hypothetical protein
VAGVGEGIALSPAAAPDAPPVLRVLDVAEDAGVPVVEAAPVEAAVLFEVPLVHPVAAVM